MKHYLKTAPPKVIATDIEQKSLVQKNDFGMDFYNHSTAGRLIKLSELDESSNLIDDINVIFQKDGTLALI